MSLEFRDRLALSREHIDRDAVSRTSAELMQGLRHDPSTRILLIKAGKAAATATATEAGAELLFFTGDDISAQTTLVYLGRDLDDASAYLAAFVENSGDLQAGSSSLTDDDWHDLRVIGTSLNARDSGLFTQALALFNWHAVHAHSPKTGSQTVAEHGGWVRRALSDNSQVFPRTDPAVIVLVTDDQDRLLLGNNAMWESNRFSLLAGFVEPGESLESAVVREVFEESGLRVVDPVYLGSQPWPFPASIMLGFTARLAPGEHPDNHTADGEEILSLKWLTRDELKACLDEIMLPGKVSIARALIEHWLGESLPQDAGWTGRK
jgi:NAD+ diphosphatase